MRVKDTGEMTRKEKKTRGWKGRRGADPGGVAEDGDEAEPQGRQREH